MLLKSLIRNSPYLIDFHCNLIKGFITTLQNCAHRNTQTPRVLTDSHFGVANFEHKRNPRVTVTCVLHFRFQTSNLRYKPTGTTLASSLTDYCSFNLQTQLITSVVPVGCSVQLNYMYMINFCVYYE